MKIPYIYKYTFDYYLILCFPIITAIGILIGFLMGYYSK